MFMVKSTTRGKVGNPSKRVGSFYVNQNCRIYFSINYEPARGTDRYCSITIKYTIDSWKTIRFYYSEDGTMLSDHNGVVKLMCVETLYNILNSIIMEYIA